MRFAPHLCLALGCLLGCRVDHAGLQGTDAALPIDGASPDAADARVARDAGETFDAGSLDAGSLDAASLDTGSFDAGSFDAGTDAPMPDAGPDVPEIDAGPSCSDGRMNQGESDIDCGGPCDVCETGSLCNDAADCVTNFCSDEDSRCRLAESCRDLLNSDGSLETGAYEIDTDASGDADPIRVWCDMSFDGGGWTLVVSTTGAGPEESTEGEVLPGDTKHMSEEHLVPLALAASQTHIRTHERADDRSVTSRPNTPPIENLRSFQTLEI